MRFSDCNNSQHSPVVTPNKYLIFTRLIHLSKLCSIREDPYDEAQCDDDQDTYGPHVRITPAIRWGAANAITTVGGRAVVVIVA